MAMVIDGHNLIGAGVFPDIRLSDEDDEAKLVARLRVWKSRYRGRMTVIFDRGIPGGREPWLGGAGVEVIFAANPAQADDLIRRRIRQQAREMILVSNDEELIREARAHGATCLRGHEFVARMAPKGTVEVEPGTEMDVRLSPAEVEEWLALFEARRRRRRTAGRVEPRAAEKHPAPRKQVPAASKARKSKRKPKR
jgi:uncharacterized protein